MGETNLYKHMSTFVLDTILNSELCEYCNGTIFTAMKLALHGYYLTRSSGMHSYAEYTKGKSLEM
jgi:hypothetical protein